MFWTVLNRSEKKRKHSYSDFEQQDHNNIQCDRFLSVNLTTKEAEKKLNVVITGMIKIKVIWMQLIIVNETTVSNKTYI